MRTKYYNIHDLLTVQIDYARDGILHDIDFPFSFFETREVNRDPDIVLKIGPFDPICYNALVVDYKYHITKTHFFCNDQSGKSKWKVEISNINTRPTVINFEGSIAGLEQFLIPNYLAQNIILRPIIELKLQKKGFAMLHGIGVSNGSDGFLFLGRGGAHKTPLIMDLLNKKFNQRITGDDRLIIGPDRELLSFPTFYNLTCFKSFHMHNEHISNVIDKLKLSKYLLKTHEENFDLFFKKASFNRIFFITPKVGITEVQNNGPLEIHTAVQKIIFSNQLEMMCSGFSDTISLVPFYRYLLAYSNIFTDSVYGQYWQELEKLLLALLRNTPIFEILLPEKYSKNTFDLLKPLMTPLKI